MVKWELTIGTSTEKHENKGGKNRTDLVTSQYDTMLEIFGIRKATFLLLEDRL